MKRKLYIVGIDGLPLWIIRELCKTGEFAGFRRLMQADAIVDAESVLPPVTASAWPSIYTGLKPSEHHIGDFFVLTRNYTPDIIFYDAEKARPFWDLLADRGLHSLVITPASVVRLSRSRNVDMITGFPLPPVASSGELARLMKKSGYTGSQSLGRRLREESISLREAASMLASDANAKVRIASEMMERHDYDIVYVCFTEIDTIGHFSIGRRDWKEYISPIFKEINALVERLLAKADANGEAALMLVSDHGFQKIESKFLINAWLVKSGYAELKESTISQMSSPAEETARSEPIYVIRDYLLKTKLRHIYRAIPMRLRPHIIQAVERVALSSKRRGYLRIYTFDFDMRRTKAFAFMSVDPICAIWINDKRFASGIVKEGARSRLVRRLKRDLERLRDERGRPLFSEIYEGRKYYTSPAGAMVPDLFAEAREGVTTDSLYYSDKSLFIEPGNARSGDHTRHGVYGFYSRSAKPGARQFSILKFASVVLSFFNARKHDY